MYQACAVLARGAQCCMSGPRHENKKRFKAVCRRHYWGADEHVCAFFNSIEMEHRVLDSFGEDGDDRGEMATHIVDPEKRQEHLWLGERERERRRQAATVAGYE